MNQYFYNRYLLFSLLSHAIFYTVELALIYELGTRIKPNLSGVLFMALMPSIIATRQWQQEFSEDVPENSVFKTAVILTILQAVMSLAFTGLLHTFRPEIYKSMIGTPDANLVAAIVIFLVVAFFGNRFGMRLAAPTIFPLPEKPAAEPELRPRYLRYWWLPGWLLYPMVTVIVLWLILMRSIGDGYVSMVVISDTAPTYGGVSNGDIVVINPVETLKREDLLLYKKRRANVFARVIAFPGEELAIEQDKFLIDGKEVDFKYFDKTPNLAAFKTPNETDKFRLSADDDGANMTLFNVSDEDVIGVLEVVFSSKRDNTNQISTMALGTGFILFVFFAPFFVRKAIQVKTFPNKFALTVYTVLFFLPVLSVYSKVGGDLPSTIVFFSEVNVAVYEILGQSISAANTSALATAVLGYAAFIVIIGNRIIRGRRRTQNAVA